MTEMDLLAEEINRYQNRDEVRPDEWSHDHVIAWWCYIFCSPLNLEVMTVTLLLNVLPVQEIRERKPIKKCLHFVE